MKIEKLTGKKHRGRRQKTKSKIKIFDIEINNIPMHNRQRRTPSNGNVTSDRLMEWSNYHHRPFTRQQ